MQEVDDGLFGDVAGSEGLPDAASEDEGERSIAHFFITAHMADETGGGEAAVQHAELGGEADGGEMGGDALCVLSGAEAEAGGEAEGEAEADGDSFAVQDAASVAVFGLQGVAEGVAEIEQRAAIRGFFLPFVVPNHGGFEFAGAVDGLRLSLPLAGDNGGPVLLAPGEQVGIADESGFGDFGVARAELSRREGGEGRSIG